MEIPMAESANRTMQTIRGRRQRQALEAAESRAQAAEEQLEALKTQPQGIILEGEPLFLAHANFYVALNKIADGKLSKAECSKVAQEALAKYGTTTETADAETADGDGASEAQA